MNKRKNNTSPLKIAVLGHKTIPSRQGGIEIVVEELTVRMAKLGHKITVFNFILVKPLGMQGIAIGTCLGYFAVLLIRARDMKIEMNIGISFKRNIFSFVLLIIHSLILISFGEIQAFL